MTEQPWRFPEGVPSHKSILAALVLARKPPPKKSCRNLRRDALPRGFYHAPIRDGSLLPPAPVEEAILAHG